jgi:hypothetical protein
VNNVQEISFSRNFETRPKVAGAEPSRHFSFVVVILSESPLMFLVENPNPKFLKLGTMTMLLAAFETLVTSKKEQVFSKANKEFFEEKKTFLSCFLDGF